MLTGYNTDVSYGGVVYHVQTEDKGIGNPVILSLVYQGGTILAAKRTPYGDLIQAGQVDERELVKMLERQHRIIVAALQAGKSERLIQLSRQNSEQSGGSQPALPTTGEIAVGRVLEAAAPAASPKAARHKAETAGKHAPAQTSHLPQAYSPQASLEQMISSYVPPVAPQERLRVELLTSPHFCAGERARVRVAVSFGGTRAAADAAVTLQIVGTRIGAQSLLARTDRCGVADFQVNIPPFTSGAAALILKASESHGQEAEVKFLIRRQRTEP
jgi:hypothetical protein